MRASFLAVAMTAMTVAPGLAADLPNRRAPPIYSPPPPVFTWTGFYVGVNAGGVFSNSSHASVIGDATTLAAVGAGTVPGSYGTGGTGFIGGGQIGYNYQMGAFVAGLEADFQGSTLSKNSTATGTLATGTLKSDLDWLGTARARLGYTVTDRFLLYATGGLAYGETKLSHTLTDPTGTVYGTTDTLLGSRTSTRVGWTLGGGGEYAITNNWSAKIEYLYYDLGHQSVTAFDPLGATASLSTVRARDNGSIVRAGLNYKF